jgi:hypothetical protein
VGRKGGGNFRFRVRWRGNKWRDGVGVTARKGGRTSFRRIGRVVRMTRLSEGRIRTDKIVGGVVAAVKGPRWRRLGWNR